MARHQDQVGEQQWGVEVAVGQQQDVAEPLAGADELTDHGTDHGEGHGHLQAGHQVRQRVREADLAEGAPRPGAHRRGEVEQLRVGGAQPGHAGDDHREERDEHRQDDLRGEAEAEPDHQQRRDGDLRDDLCEQDDRVERLVQGAGVGDGDRGDQTQRGGQHEAEHRLVEGDQCVPGQLGPLGGHRLPRPGRGWAPGSSGRTRGPPRTTRRRRRPRAPAPGARASRRRSPPGDRAWAVVDGLRRVAFSPPWTRPRRRRHGGAPEAGSGCLRTARLVGGGLPARRVQRVLGHAEPPRGPARRPWTGPVGGSGKRFPGA